MTNHLTVSEIEQIVVEGSREALWGAVAVMVSIAILAVTTLTVAPGVLPSKSKTFTVAAGLFAVGIGLIAHGLYRRNQAKLALAEMPMARVHSQRLGNRSRGGKLGT